MTRERITAGPLEAMIRECWIMEANRRLSGDTPTWADGPLIHSIVVEWVKVQESQRRQGHLRRFLDLLCSDARFEMVVVEAVQNPVLADALLRWDWECDPGVMDFYHMRADKGSKVTTDGTLTQETVQ